MLDMLESSREENTNQVELDLVNGEDLARFRRVSSGVFSTLVRVTECEMERLGMDENWVDVGWWK